MPLAASPLLVLLKVTGVVDWPWLAILIPIWLLILAYLLGYLVALVEHLRGGPRYPHGGVRVTSSGRAGGVLVVTEAVLDEAGSIDVRATMKQRKHDLRRQSYVFPVPGRKRMLRQIRADLEQARDQQNPGSSDEP